MLIRPPLSLTVPRLVALHPSLALWKQDRLLVLCLFARLEQALASAKQGRLSRSGIECELELERLLALAAGIQLEEAIILLFACSSKDWHLRLEASLAVLVLRLLGLLCLIKHLHRKRYWPAL